MHKKLIFFFLLINTITYSQHTDRFKEFTAHIKPIDSTIIDIKFSNGKLKETGIINIYEYGDYQYQIYSGKITKYYRSGVIKSIDELDSFGNLLSSQLYDYEGTPYCYMNTLKIDTEAKNLDEFFNSEKHLSILIYSKRYRFSPFSNKWFLLEEGKYINGTKTGEWTKYNRDGTVKQTTSL